MPALTTGLRIAHARDILGDDFITPTEVAACLRGVVYSSEQYVDCRDTLPPLEVLQWCRDHDYMVVAGPPEQKSLLDIRSRWPNYFYAGPGATSLDSENETFPRNDVVPWGWTGLRKGPVPGSMNRSRPSQLRLLDDLESVPNVAQLFWGLIVYHKVRGINLPPHFFVRTSSVDSTGNHVGIGGHGVGKQSGIHFRSWNNAIARPDLGLASCLQ